jgi:rRNA processing protein Gar1
LTRARVDMKYLGEVQEVSFDGKLIVKGVCAPQPRETVTDNRRRPIGRVVRVFGPVASPYVSVEVTGDSSLLSAVGKQVYVEGVDELGKGGKRRSR